MFPGESSPAELHFPLFLILSLLHRPNWMMQRPLQAIPSHMENKRAGRVSGKGSVWEKAAAQEWLMG